MLHLINASWIVQLPKPFLVFISLQYEEYQPHHLSTLVTNGLQSFWYINITNLVHKCRCSILYFCVGLYIALAMNFLSILIIIDIGVILISIGAYGEQDIESNSATYIYSLDGQLIWRVFDMDNTKHLLIATTSFTHTDKQC